MKVLLLAFAIGFGSLIQAQSFSWDNEQPQQENQEAVAANPGLEERGLALVYPDYYEGNPTALGETFQQNLLTGAHQEFPLGTVVKVTRLDNGLSTTVRINDRGAYCDNCIIDLSRAAAQQINLQPMGRSQVLLTVIGYSERNPSVNGTVDNYTAEPRFTARGLNTHAPTTTAASRSYPTTQAEPQLTAKGGQLPPPNEFRNENTTPNYNNHNRSAPATATTRTMPAPAPASTAVPEEVVITTTSQGLQIIEHPISTFAVQLGSYSKYSNAERHATRLNSEGFKDVYLLKEKAADGSLLHRVIIAPFHVLEEAQAYQNDLRKMYQMKSLVFQARMVEVD